MHHTSEAQQASQDDLLKKKELISQIKKPLANTQSVITFKNNEAIPVIQGEYAITHAGSSCPVLGTWGALPCVILAIYDKKNKLALLAHVDAMSDPTSLDQALKNFSKPDSVAHLYGGTSSIPPSAHLIEYLQKNKITIVNADIDRDPSLPSASLAIDSRNGNIFTPVNVDNFKIDEGLIKKITNLPLENERLATVLKEKQLKFIREHLYMHNEELIREMQKILVPMREAYHSVPGFFESFVRGIKSFSFNSNQENPRDQPNPPKASSKKI